MQIGHALARRPHIARSGFVQNELGDVEPDTACLPPFLRDLLVAGTDVPLRCLRFP